MKLLNLLLQLISSFFLSKKVKKSISQAQNDQTRPFHEDELAETPSPQVDWSNPYAKISDFFTVKDALYLPSWKIMHAPSDYEKINILKLAKKLDLLCSKFGKMVVHCWIRPTKVNAPDSDYHSKNYNAFVGSSPSSGHVDGRAIDFHFSGQEGIENCDKMRKKLLPWLEPMDLRLEDIQGNWLHLDFKPVGKSGNRFFKP